MNPVKNTDRKMITGTRQAEGNSSTNLLKITKTQINMVGNNKSLGLDEL